MPRMREMGHFWAQNEHIGTFLKIGLLDFSEIVRDGRY